MVHVRPAAVKAAFFALLILWNHLVPTASASNLEGASAFYSESQLEALVTSITGTADSDRLSAGEGQKSSMTMGYTGKRITFKEPGNLLKEQLGGGKTTISEHSVALNFEQGLRVGTQVGVFGGGTKSKLSDARYFGAKLTQWFRRETLQTTWEARRTDLKSPPIEYTDTDGKRIRTPADLHGLNLNLSLMHFTTPTTILRGSVSATQRSDRPAASAESVELRQFIVAADAAVHVAATHYENVGTIDDTQTYGSIVANNVRVEWHQRVLKRGVIMGGYRYYLEGERPRAADADLKRLGTDALYTTLRWRFGAGMWTAEAPEAYMFAARYNTNVPTHGSVLGFGGRIIW